jgi:hypothetical protein
MRAWERFAEQHRFEVTAAILLALAALATSWSSYQSTLWNSEQSRFMAATNSARLCVARASTRAGQQRIVDVVTFLGWASAHSSGNRQLATFYERRARREFAPAFRAWLAKEASQRDSAAPLPFEMPEYRLATDAQADACERIANVKSAAALDANAVGDRYMLGTIVFAVVLFFAGAAQSVHSRRVGVALLSAAAFTCAVGIVAIARLPVTR